MNNYINEIYRIFWHDIYIRSVTIAGGDILICASATFVAVAIVMDKLKQN